MPLLARSDGIVLRQIRHGETSLIVTVFTRDYGKVGLMAKGVRGARKLGSTGAFEVLSETQFVFYRRPGRDLQMYKEVTSIAPHLALRDDLDLMCVASGIVELLIRCLQDEDPHPELYDAASRAIGALNDRPASPLPLLWQFEMELFKSLGFGLQLATCADTGKPLEPPFHKGIRYRLPDGGFLHPDAVPRKPADGELLPETFSLMSRICRSSSDFAGRVSVSARPGNELILFLARYLETHLPVRGQLASLRALKWSSPAS